MPTRKWRPSSEYFRNEDRRTALQEYISELENLFEIISPDPFLRPYLGDYDAIMRIYTPLCGRRSTQESTLIGPSSAAAELVQEHTTASPIQASAVSIS